MRIGLAYTFNLFSVYININKFDLTCLMSIIFEVSDHICSVNNLSNVILILLVNYKALYISRILS